MSWLEKAFWHRVKVEDVEIPATGEIQQSEEIAALTTGMTFSPAGRPALDVNEAISVEWVDVSAGITRYQFGGLIATIDANSDPQTHAIPCSGPLSLLRNARKQPDGDLELTGMTDGEVVEAVLTYCGVDFDPADIQDAGYELGEKADLFWRVDEPGSQIIRDLDEILGMTTIEVMNGRVVRFAYDLAPSGTGVVRTFTKGTDRDLFQLTRSYGNPDQIQNTYGVRGVTIDCGPQKACQCTPWAKARDANPALGSTRYRTPRGQFQSDIIQDEALAEQVVRRLMRWNNRLKDTVTIQTLNNTNIRPGAVIEVEDQTTYIDADPSRYCTVTSVDRTGHVLTIAATCGAAGDVGTVTHGVERLCNETDDTEDWPGDYDAPDYGFPPVDDGLEFDEETELPELDDMEELTDPEPPNITDPVLSCTEQPGMIGTEIVPPDELGNLDWQFVEDNAWRVISGAGVTTSTGIGAHLDEEGNVEEILIYGELIRNFRLNTTTGVNADKDEAGDAQYGPKPVTTMSGSVWFGGEGLSLEVRLPGDGGDNNVIFSADPGSHITGQGQGDHYWAVKANGENRAGHWAELRPPHDICSHPNGPCNNGGLMGKDAPLALETWHDFTITWNFTDKANRIDITIAGISGYLLEHTCWGTSCQYSFGNDFCTHEHYVQFSARGLDDSWTRENPAVKVKINTIGHSTCVVNPDYIPETTDTIA